MKRHWIPSLPACLLAFPLVAFAVEPTPSPEPTPAWQGEVRALHAEIVSLRAAVATVQRAAEARAMSESPPPWAATSFAEVDRRMERLMQLEERIAAGIEKPAPRLSEPVILFTVALATGILGFLGGRIVGRRSLPERRGRL